MNPSPVLVGREQEMAALRKLLADGGGVAVISGEAGIGKSRLVREFAAEAAQRGRVVLWGRPEEVAQPGPYALIADLLESIVERGGAKVKSDTRTLEAELLRPADERTAPTPRSVAAEVRGLIAELGRPPLVLIEDLQWADEVSLSALLPISRAAEDDGHLIVLTLRREAVTESSVSRLLDTLHRDRIATDIRLAPLDEEHVAQMIEAIWGRTPKPDELATLLRLGGGVPFFVEELSTESLVGDVSVPPSVGQAISARVQGLGVEGSVVLTTGSLMVGAIDPVVLATAVGIPRDRILDHLSTAAKAGLMADHEGKLGFRHALIREAIAGTVVSVERARIHAALARAIESTYEDELDRHATALLTHYREAGDAEPAVRWAIVAGTHALALASMDEARSAFEYAIALSRRSAADAFAGLGEVELREGNEESAATLFRDAAKKLHDQGRNQEAAKQLGRCAWALQAGEEPSLVANVLEEALSWLTGAESSQTYAELLVQKGIMLALLFRQFDEARPILLEGVQVAQRLGSPALLATCLDGLAWVAENAASREDADVYGEQAVEAAERSGEAEIIGRTHNNLAIRLAWHGRPHDAISFLERAREQLQRKFGSAAVGAIDVTHAWVARLMGRPVEVGDFCARGRAAWRDWQAYRRTLEVWAALEGGDLELARVIVGAAWAEVGGPDVRMTWLDSPPGPGPTTSQTLHADALLRLADDDDEEALKTAQALASVEEAGTDYFDQGLSLIILVKALIRVGRPTEAEELLVRLDQLSSQHSYPYLQAWASELRGHAASITNGTAASYYANASDQFAGCSNTVDQVRCLRLTAEALMASNADHKREAVELLRRARGLAQEDGARLELNRAEALLRSMGIRPRAGRPRRSAESDGALSPREAEITILVAAGSTNAEIAERLFLSERTVQDHITHALRKLSLPSRAALASWAAKRGMV